MIKSAALYERGQRSPRLLRLQRYSKPQPVFSSIFSLAFSFKMGLRWLFTSKRALCCSSPCTQQWGGGSGSQGPWMQQGVRPRGRCRQSAALRSNLQKLMHPGPLPWGKTSDLLVLVPELEDLGFIMCRSESTFSFKMRKKIPHCCWSHIIWKLIINILRSHCGYFGPLSLSTWHGAVHGVANSLTQLSAELTDWYCGITVGALDLSPSLWEWAIHSC